jgi:putative tryptophan/tyrosine transport system substrate-binding protein
MDRRRFLLTSLAGAFAAPRAAEAQPAEKGKVYRIGSIGSEMPTPAGREQFWDRMRELGWVQGQNVVIERRVFGADFSRIPEITRELISLGTDVFVVPDGSVAFGVQRVTRTISIVTTSAGDLEAARFAASVGRPGGNVTGLQVMLTELGGKHLSLLREIVPRLSRVGALVGAAGFSEATEPPTHPAAAYIRGIRSDALSLGLQPQVVVVTKGDEFAAAFSAFKAQRAQAIVVYGSNPTFTFRKTIIALALEHQLPTISVDGERMLRDGILMSYGWDNEINLRLAAEFVDRILRGAKAGDIPIQQPTTFRLGINLKTAKTFSGSCQATFS